MERKNTRIVRLSVRLFLAVCLAASALVWPGPIVRAAEEFAVGSAAELLAAIEAAADGDTVRLTADIDCTDRITITDKLITLDLNGKTLNVTQTVYDYALKVANGGFELAGGGQLNVAGHWFALQAENGGIATVTNATGTSPTWACAIQASGAGTRIKVLGDVTTELMGVAAYGEGCVVEIEGDVLSDVAGVRAENLAEVTVAGSVTTGYDYGVHASTGAKVTIEGNVTITGDSSTAIGAKAQLGGNVHVDGNVSAPNGLQAWSNDIPRSSIYVGGHVTATLPDTGVGVECLGHAEVTVDGSISAAQYTRFRDAVIKSQSDTTAPTTKLGYLTYSYSNDEGLSEVWVKDPEVSITAVPNELSAAGGPCEITISGNDLPDGIRVKAYMGSLGTLITGVTAGSDTEQVATLTFPNNPSYTEDKVYTIRASLDGGIIWAPFTTEVTVRSVFYGAVCRIGSTPYYSLTDAVSGAWPGDTIVLLKDIVLENDTPFGSKVFPQPFPQIRLPYREPEAQASSR